MLSLRTVWPSVGFGASLDSFRLFTEEGSVPAEKVHLENDWREVMSDTPEASDMFIVKAGRIHQVFILGLMFFPSPGENC
ncbi:MAG: hypothetical protein ACYCR5_10505 [Leptospirillum sp.]